MCAVWVFSHRSDIRLALKLCETQSWGPIARRKSRVTTAVCCPWFKPFPARNPICDLFTVGEVGLWSFGRPCVRCRDPGDCLVCSVAIPATVFPSCLCGLTTLVSRKVFWLVAGSDVFQTQKKSGPKGFWQKQSQSMAGRSGRANSVQNRMCGRGGIAGDVIIISQRRCTGKYRQAVAAKSGEWSTGSSASSGEEERKSSKPGS